MYLFLRHIEKYLDHEIADVIRRQFLDGLELVTSCFCDGLFEVVDIPRRNQHVIVDFHSLLDTLNQVVFDRAFCQLAL